MKLRILKELASDACFLREQRTSYWTNRAVKAFGLWVILTNETPSGWIHSPHVQASHLEKLCKKSFRTICRWAEEAEKFGLIKIKRCKTFRGNEVSGWSLTSIQDVCRQYDLNTEYHTIDYDLHNENQTIDYILKALEIDENKAKQERAYMRKQKLNPIVNRAVVEEAGRFNVPAKGNSNPQELAFIQQKTFSFGGSHLSSYNAIHEIVNPDFQRGTAGISRAHRFKNQTSATYLKRALQKRGLADVQKRAPIVCKYTEDTSKMQVVLGRKSKGFRRYDRATFTSSWFLPDRIITKLNYI